MLSRVIGLKDTAAADPHPFAPAPLSRNHPRTADRPAAGAVHLDSPAADALLDEITRLNAANHALTAGTRTMEAQLVTVKNEAFEQGRTQGHHEAQADFTPIAEKMRQSIADTITTRSEARHKAESDVVELALRIARRILHRELATDANSLTALAKVVFQRMARTEAYTLTIHPQFLTAVQSVLSATQTAKVKIESDPGCAPGTFIIKSVEGTLDASIDTQLEEITRGLADRLATT